MRVDQRVFLFFSFSIQKNTLEKHMFLYSLEKHMSLRLYFKLTIFVYVQQTGSDHLIRESYCLFSRIVPFTL